jgi:hypothetical protein
VKINVIPGSGWLLDSEADSDFVPGQPYQMEKVNGSGDDGQTLHVQLSGRDSGIWLSDQAAQADVVFPFDVWKVVLNTRGWSGGCSVEVGEWGSDGDRIVFTPFNTPVSGTPDDGIIVVNIRAGGTVPAGHYLALRVSTGADEGGYIITEGCSYLASPPGNPGYPLPELSTAVLLVLGLAGLGVWVLRKRLSKHSINRE